MIRITEVAFVAYPISDIPRARNFYENVLGLSPGAMDDEIEGMPGKQWIEYEVGNVTLAISNAWEPSTESCSRLGDGCGYGGCSPPPCGRSLLRSMVVALTSTG